MSVLSFTSLPLVVYPSCKELYKFQVPNISIDTVLHAMAYTGSVVLGRMARTQAYSYMMGDSAYSSTAYLISGNQTRIQETFVHSTGIVVFLSLSEAASRPTISLGQAPHYTAQNISGVVDCHIQGCTPFKLFPS